MADNVRGGSNDAALPLIATDDVGGAQYQRVKLDVGGNGLSVPVVGALPVDASGAAVPVTDNGDSLTVDGTVGVSGTVTVDASDLDIRALAQATDSVAIGDGMTILPVIDVGEGEPGIRVRLYPFQNIPVVSGSPLEVQPLGTHNQGQYTPFIYGMGSAAASAEPSAVNSGYGVQAYIDTTGHLHVRADGAATGAKSSVSGSASSVTLLAANVDRLGATIFNDSSAILYVDLSGGTATSSSFSVKLVADAYLEVPAGYKGAITGVWASATGAARVTEFV